MFFRKKPTPAVPAPAAVRAVACKICGCDAHYFDSVDFSQNCQRLADPPAGVPVPYHRCANCGFLFTALCDGWTQAEFAQRLFNDDYIRIDPEFARVRPLEQAAHFSALIEARKGRTRLLDYGGGAGVFARRMGELGFDAACYDPFHYSELAPPDDERFELVHCREVLEHASDPQGFVADIVRRMADDSAIYLSTVTQPPDILQVRLGWWYAGPRNGHISLFSHASLAMLWEEHGFEFGSFNGYLHLAWRGQPACLPSLTDHGARRLFKASEL